MPLTVNAAKENCDARAARVSLLHMAPAGCSRALDVGCSIGATGAWLKQNRGVSEVVGLEINEQAAHQAAKVLDRVVSGDVETVALEYPAGYFDLIIYADVLEHLRDPWGLLQRQALLLKQGGYVLASIPNVANWRVVAGLLRNKWDYKDYGTMDKTHVRFFTLPGMIRMFAGAGYEITETRGNRGRLSSAINTITCGVFGHLVTFQYYFLLRKGQAF